MLYGVDFHPSFYKSKNPGQMAWEDEQYSEEGILCVSGFLDKDEITFREGQEGWRVLPAPRLDATVQNNQVNVGCAIINPYSENKELAMEYLEAVAQNPNVLNGFMPAILFKDMSMYEGIYDMSVPVMQDIYSIVKEGVFGESSYPFLFDLVNDYQQGRYTLDEAIEKIQRDTEMWLNE